MDVVAEYNPGVTGSDLVNMAVRTINGIKYYVDAAGHVHSTVNKIREKVSEFRKRHRNDSSPKEEADPQNQQRTKSSHMVVPGQLDLFTGGDVQLPPLTARIGLPKTADNIKHFLETMNRKGFYRNEFQCQYVGDDQVRSCQMMIFRHRKSDRTTSSRFLKATSTFNGPTINVGNPAVATGINGMGINFFNSSLGASQGKVMWSDVGLNDMEEYGLQLLGKHAVRDDVHYGETTVETVIESNDSAFGSAKLVLPLWVGQNNQSVSTASIPRKQYKAVIRDGGIQFDFQNKHPTGCFIELIVVRFKRDKFDNITSNIDLAGFDEPLKSYGACLGKAYVKKINEKQGSISAQGYQAAASDVLSNPYAPFLPTDSRNTDKNTEYMSQKSRYKFALPSGAKRHVKISFGGHVYDPRDTLGGAATLAASTFNDLTIGIIIAINGQHMGALFTSNSGAQLVSGNVCTGHNVFVKGEYYENIQALKMVPDSNSTVNTRGTIEGRVPTTALPANVTMSTYQMLAANTVQRRERADGHVDPGIAYNMKDGNPVNDNITPP